MFVGETLIDLETVLNGLRSYGLRSSVPFLGFFCDEVGDCGVVSQACKGLLGDESCQA